MPIDTIFVYICLMIRKLCLFCLAASALLLQSASNVSLYGLSSGLPSNNIVGMSADKNGFLWMATNGGVVRYDHNHFVTFTRANGLAGNSLNCVMDDPLRPLMWIGSQRDGLSAYNYQENTWTTFRHSNEDNGSIAGNDITSLAPATHGNVLISFYGEGIDCYNQRTGRFTHFNQHTVRGLVSNMMWSVCQGPGNTLYAGHVYNGFSVINTRTHTAVNYCGNKICADVPVTEVRCVFRDNRGYVWLGTNYGLVLFIPQTRRFVCYFKAMPQLMHVTYVIRQYAPNQICVGTGSTRVMLINTAMDVTRPGPNISFLTVNDAQDAEPDEEVTSLLRDEFGNLWVGTMLHGLSFISHMPKLFYLRTYSSNPYFTRSLTDRKVNALAFTPQGRMLLGTGHGLQTMAGGERAGVQMPQLNVAAVLYDSQGTEWLGAVSAASSGGLFYKPASATSFTRLYQNNELRYLSEYQHRYVLAGTVNGVDIIDELTFKVVAHINVPVNFVWAVAADEKGRIWVGTFGGGLYVYSPSRKLLASFSVDKGFPSNSVFDIRCLPGGSVWVATDNGLVNFHHALASKYRVYQPYAPLHDNTVHALTPDRLGNIWFSTHRGIGCVSKGRIILYPGSNDFPDGVFCNASAATDAAGWIYFGSTAGLCYFNPSTLLSSQSKPRSIISEVAVAGISRRGEAVPDSILLVKNGEKLRLNYRQNTVTFTFTQRDQAMADRVEYACMLRGLDRDFMPVDPESHRVTYRSLPYGHYEVVLKSRLINQPWSQPQKVLTLTIEPPLWFTWWAKLLYVLFALAFVYVLWHLFRWYRRKRREIESNQQMVENERKAVVQREHQLDERSKEIEQEARRRLADKQQQLQQALHKLDAQFAQTLMTTIKQNLDNPDFDVNVLAAQMGMSASTLYRRMTQATGMSPKTFITRVKMNMAESLILDGDKNITEISYRLGYNNVISFRAAFKKEFGVLPSEFIDRLKAH